MILGIGTGDRPLLALGKRPASLATVRSAIGAIRALWSGDNVTVGGPRLRAPRRAPAFRRAGRHPGLRLGERSEDARTGGRDRRRGDPARRPVPGGARVGARARRSGRREGRAATAARGRVRVWSDRRRRRRRPGLRTFDRRVVPADGPGDLRAGGLSRAEIERCPAAVRRGRVPGGGGSGAPAAGRVRAEGGARGRRAAGPGAHPRRWPTRVPTPSMCSRSEGVGSRRSRRSPGASPT